MKDDILSNHFITILLCIIEAKFIVYYKHIICSFMRQITADVSFLRYALKELYLQLYKCISIFEENFRRFL